MTETSSVAGSPTEVIILAGGKGTRIQELVSDLPKALAPVAGQPFLTYLLRRLLQQGMQRFIFSLGYRHEDIISFIEKRFPYLDHQFVIEKAPLDTGGAIRAAIREARTETPLVVNGDSFFEVDLSEGWKIHQASNATCTLFLKPMAAAARYGIVTLSGNAGIKSFNEKEFATEGLINGGWYLLNKTSFLNEELPALFSFENEYLAKKAGTSALSGSIQEGYFIDIGLPEDFHKAQHDFKLPAFSQSQIDKSWTLFLDRDGVINHDKVGSYIFNPSEFRLYEGVASAIARLGKTFGRTLVVTNQRGVGRGLMSEDDLSAIHAKMMQAMEEAGAHIEQIYYCTATYNQHPNRKPLPGMALQAVRDYPDIDLSSALMVGNNLSDMQFGRNAGMRTVYLTTTNPPEALPHPDIDLQYGLLTDFVNDL